MGRLGGCKSRFIKTKIKKCDSQEILIRKTVKKTKLVLRSCPSKHKKQYSYETKPKETKELFQMKWIFNKEYNIILSEAGSSIRF